MDNAIPYILPENVDDVLARVDVYARSGERTAPALFVGRTDIRKHIAGRIDDHLIGNHPADCLTEVIHGAPGVGKTSLLHQLQLEHEVKGIAVVRMEGNALNDRLAFTEKFVEGFGASLRNIHTAQTQKPIGVTKLMQLTFGSEKSTSPLSEQLERDSNVWRIACENLHIRTDTEIPPVLLLIDEAQRVQGGTAGGDNTLCTDLHALDTGRFRVLPVFAGLGDTVISLGAAGLSRLDRHAHAMDNLSREECEEATAGLFETATHGFPDMFSRNDQKLVARHLAIASEGWPRHLHCYMRAFVTTLGVDIRQGTPFLLDLREVLDRGHIERIEYCRQRVLMGRFSANFEGLLAEHIQSNTDNTLRFLPPLR